MLTRSLDTNHDWNFGNGKQHYLDEKSALNQNVQTTLLSFVGDCFFDLEAGIDWFNFLGSKNLEGLRRAIAYKLASVSGVITVNDVSISTDTERNANIVYNLTTVWDPTLQGNISI